MKRSSSACTAIAIAISCHAIYTGIAFAVPQDAGRVSDAVAPIHAAGEPPAQYLITLSEYRLKDVDRLELTAAKIAAAIKAENAHPIETIVLSATSGAESTKRNGWTTGNSNLNLNPKDTGLLTTEPRVARVSMFSVFAAAR